MPSPVPNPSREIEKLWTRTWDMPASRAVGDLRATATRAVLRPPHLASATAICRPVEPRPGSEAEASQAARLCAQHDCRRAWLDAMHVPRRWPLRRCVERGRDAAPAVIGLRRPAVVRPGLRGARHRLRICHPRCLTLDDDVCVADRHRDRAAWIARDVAALPGPSARL